MARNGSGSYTNPYPNFVAGTVISSDQVDANNSAIATALTQSIAVDGQSTVTGNIPMSSKKFTGLTVGSASTDSATLGQVQASAYVFCGTMGGAADAGTLAPTPAITAYAAGQRFFWKASTSSNTGAMTVAISGLSTIAMQSDRAALAAGDHVASDIYMGILDTTSTMQIMKIADAPAASATVAGLIEIATDAETLTGTDATRAVSPAGLTSVYSTIRSIPQNSKSAAYTLVLADAGKHIYHPGADTTARIWTIPANASVAYPIGTAITFVNDTSGGVITIAITSDVLVLSPDGTTGSRSLAANGIATCIKMTATRWMISGSGLT
jgi:hypothetical protein